MCIFTFTFKYITKFSITENQRMVTRLKLTTKATRIADWQSDK